ncbi:MAG: hypothetical protein EX271_05740 [Acidimicrobiales bacterium]|nr:hypothetical protein [Hyphomonadaceae bacterium]RZV42527.1 MAG: hypothetical protein EX271_05740 [Acidimicrobiales bacterium]
MKIISSLALIFGIGLMVAPAQAQQSTKNKPIPKSNMQIKAPKVTASGTFIRCQVKDVAMTSEGLGFYCKLQEGKSYLVATDGGSGSGGLAAFSNIVLNMAEEPNKFRQLRVKEAKGSALKVCGLMAPKARNRNCVQAMFVKISATDSSVNVGDAHPNAPSVPTQPASPNYPNVPTEPARPD